MHCIDATVLNSFLNSLFIHMYEMCVMLYICIHMCFIHMDIHRIEMYYTYIAGNLRAKAIAT